MSTKCVINYGTLQLSKEKFDALDLSDAHFVVEFDFRTFFDLVSFGMELEARR